MTYAPTQYELITIQKPMRRRRRRLSAFDKKYLRNLNSHDQYTTKPEPLSDKNACLLTVSAVCKQETGVWMSELDRQQVNAIKSAYKQAVQLVKSRGAVKQPEDITTALNVTELATRRLILFFKLIGDFQDLEHCLMAKLLKHSMPSLLQVHGVISYNADDNTFREPNTDDMPVSASCLQIVYGLEMHRLIITLATSLRSICPDDTTHMLLLMLIVLFDPSNQSLNQSEKQHVVNLLNKYFSLLYSYLKEVIGNDRARFAFNAISSELNKITDLGFWLQKAVRLNASVDRLRPLMKELFISPSDSPTPPSFSHTGVVQSSY
jgi:hypothetical protein